MLACLLCVQYDAVKRYVGLPHVSPCTPNTLGHHTQDLTGACTHSVDRNSTALRGVKSPFTPSRPDRCLRDAIESLVRAGAAEPHAARFAAAHGVLAATHHTPTLHLRRAREARARLPAAALCRRGDRPPPTLVLLLPRSPEESPTEKNVIHDRHRHRRRRLPRCCRRLLRCCSED